MADSFSENPLSSVHSIPMYLKLLAITILSTMSLWSKVTITSDAHHPKKGVSLITYNENMSLIQIILQIL